MTTTKKTVSKKSKEPFRLQHYRIHLEYNKIFEKEEMEGWYTDFSKELKEGIKTVSMCIIDKKTSILVEFGGKVVKRTPEDYFEYSEKLPKMCSLKVNEWRNKENEHNKNPAYQVGIIKKPIKISKPILSLPPQTNDYRIEEKEKPIHSTVYKSSNSNKPLMNYLSTTISPLHKELKVQYCMLTVNLVPTDIPIRMAWDTIPLLEKQITDILFEFKEVKYISSTIEVHPALKGSKKKLTNPEDIAKEKIKKKVPLEVKGQEKKENEEDEFPDDEYSDGEEDTTEYPKHDEHHLYFQKTSNESKLQSIIKVFQLYDSKLRSSIYTKDDDLILVRMIDYMNLNKIKLDVGMPKTYKELDAFYTQPIYDSLLERGITDEACKGPQKAPKKMKGLPHIHMAIARSTLSDGDYRPLGTYKRSILGKTIFKDVVIEDKLLEQGQVSKSVRKRGSKLQDSSEENILGYIHKNNQHEEVINHLAKGRYPCTLYNPNNIAKVDKLFDEISRKFALSINEVTVTDSTPLEVEEDDETHLTIEQKKENKRLDKIAAYMKNKNYAFHYNTNGNANITIWEKIPGAISAWKPIKLSPEQLWGEMISINKYADIRKHHVLFREIYISPTQTKFPTVKIDYYLTEFNGFIFDRRSNTITTLHTNPCFGYYPHIDIEDIKEIKPKYYSDVLEKSGYINSEGECINQEGKDLLTILYEFILEKIHKGKCPAFWGDSSSGKSYLIICLMALYPNEVAVALKNITEFTVGSLYGALVCFFDEIKDTIPFKDISELLEGERNLNVNIKGIQGFTELINVTIASVANELAIYGSAHNIHIDPPAYNSGNKKPTPLVLPSQPVTIDKNKPKPPPRSRTQKLLKDVDIYPPYKTRMQFYHFMGLKTVVTGMKDKTKTEAGEALLWLAKHYYNSSPLPVEDLDTLKKLKKEGIKRMKARKTTYMDQFSSIGPISLLKPKDDPIILLADQLQQSHT